MKTYYVRLWCFELNEYARFIVRAPYAMKAGSQAQAYVTDGRNWTVDVSCLKVPD